MYHGFCYFKAPLLFLSFYKILVKFLMRTFGSRTVLSVLDSYLPMTAAFVLLDTYFNCQI